MIRPTTKADGSTGYACAKGEVHDDATSAAFCDIREMNNAPLPSGLVKAAKLDERKACADLARDLAEDYTRRNDFKMARGALAVAEMIERRK